MTDFNVIPCRKQDRIITDKAMLVALLERNTVATVSMHDEPYPYAVQMNYGYEWDDDELILYFHCAGTGHRFELLNKNPKVVITIFEFLDRYGYATYRKETHDYRSIHAYGEAEILYPDQEEEYLHGFSVMNQHNSGRPEIKKITTDWRNRLRILKVHVHHIMGKAQYGVTSMEELTMPENVSKTKE